MTELKGTGGSVSFDGKVVSVKKRHRGETRIPVRNIAAIEMGRASIGKMYIRFATAGTGYASQAGRVVKNNRVVFSDPEVLVFRRKHQPEFVALRDEVEAAIQ